MVQAHLHVSKDLMKVAREAVRIDATANRLGDKQLPLPVPRGANVELFLEFDKDLIIGRPHRQLKWEGAPANEVFEVEVPANLVSESIKGLMTVAVDSVPVGDIEFKLHVTTSVNVSTEEAAETRALKYEYAFMSYSRKDFTEASIFAQGLERGRVNLLVDVTALEPGDDWAKELTALIGRADVFYLIWSENASNSEWVDKEARHAERLYDTSDPCRPRIIPMPLKRPMPKLPDYLSKFHFNSSWLDRRTAHQVPLFDKSS
jgi:TIR domain-containing protein